ncbi:MAG: succinate dehydrogenase, cytochrome b556 subunit [Parasulfuritortus sp.]|nr:succinate dehydrogenase, cytochrome b556 subunit [Parasulfuritortus sp.]
MRPTRPFYLNLIQIRLPIGGFVSILHRASGAALSLVVPALLYVLMLSLRSEADFAQIRNLAGGVLGALVGLGLVWALIHHFLAGLRHLGFDIGWGESKLRARMTAWIVLFAALLLTAVAAVGWLA